METYGLHCLECERKFIPSQANVQIIGPDVLVKCPFCSYEYKGKMTSFVRDLIGGWRLGSPTDAMRMMELARYIELNSSDYYKRRGLRHGEKKVRNVRD